MSNSGDPNHVYFFTDGEITGDGKMENTQSLKVKLKNEIEKLFLDYNNVHFHLYTVENQDYDFGNSETLTKMAGGDVFEVIRGNQLTKFVCEFVSFSPKHYRTGYNHISSLIVPLGFVPFGNKMFSEVKTNLFLKYLIDLVKENKDKEDELLKIVQNLSSSLRVITKDKPKFVSDQIMNTFCDVFSGTVLDESFVKFLLVDSILLEKQGKMAIFSEYRAKLKNLYRQAQDLLLQNTFNALGYSRGGDFCTLPIGGEVIVTGSVKFVEKDIVLGGQCYPQSSILVDNEFVVPVVPLLKLNSLKPQSAMNEQCMRQFVRAIVSKQYKVNATDDAISLNWLFSPEMKKLHM